VAARLPGPPELGLGFVLARHVQHVDALIGQRAHRRVQGLRREIGAVERHYDVGHGHRASLPSQRHEVRQLIRR